MSLGGIFGGLWDGAKSAITDPIDSAKSLFKGDVKGAIEPLKHMPGNQERANSKVLNEAGVRGWVGDHPWSIPAAVAGGMYGAGALGAGGTGGAAGGTGASTGAGGIQSYMVPSASFKSPAAAQAAGSQAGIGNTNFLLNMGNAGMNNPLSTGGASKFTPAMLSKEGALSAAGNSAGMQAASTEALGGVPESLGSTTPKHSVDYERMMKALQTVVPNERLEAQYIGGGGGSGGFRPGFNFDRKLYENPLLTKSYGDLYFSPGSR